MTDAAQADAAAIPGFPLAKGELTLETGLELVRHLVASWKVRRGPKGFTYMVRLVDKDEKENESPDNGLHYEAIFSKPTMYTPVPTACVKVAFCVTEDPLRITYQFEHEDAQYFVTVLDTGHFSSDMTLPKESWQPHLDRTLRKKVEIRQLQNMKLDFEETRTVEMSSEGSESESGSEYESDEEASSPVQTTSWSVTRDTSQSTRKKGELLANIFDAADEDATRVLMHLEVGMLLEATLKQFGLSKWDIWLLMKEAAEDEQGYIAYTSFVQAAPELIETLAARRLQYRGRWAAYVRRNPDAVDEDGDIHLVSLEACEVCYGDDAAETSRLVTDLLTVTDVDQSGFVTRAQLREAVYARPDRISPQEATLLMQSIPQTEAGLVEYSKIMPHPSNPKAEMSLLYHELLQLRIGALHNSIIETDVPTLWKSLVLLLRRNGLEQPDETWSPWRFRDILLKADQLCLPMLIIYILLAQLPADHFGKVPVMKFLEVACTLIPQFFNVEAFLERVEVVESDMAENQRKAELAEMEGMMGGMMSKLKQKTDKGEEEEESVDREQAEKMLLHAMSVMDDKHKLTLSEQQVMTVVQNTAEQCRLSEFEVRGLLGQMHVEEGEVAYIDFLKTWVPIIFEVRDSAAWGQFVGDLSEMDIPRCNVDELSAKFPPVANVQQHQGGGVRTSRLSLKGRLSKRSQTSIGKVAGGAIVGGAVGNPNLLHIGGATHTHGDRLLEVPGSRGDVTMSKRSRLSRGLSQVRNASSISRHSRIRRHENPAMQTMMYNPRRIACERVAEQRRELLKAKEPASPACPTSPGSEKGSKISKRGGAEAPKLPDGTVDRFAPGADASNS